MTIELKLVRRWVSEAKIGAEKLGYQEGTQVYRDHIRRSVYTRRNGYILRQKMIADAREDAIRRAAGEVH